MVVFKYLGFTHILDFTDLPLLAMVLSVDILSSFGVIVSIGLGNQMFIGNSSLF